MTVNERVEYLKEFYKEKGIGFAKYINISPSTISNIVGARKSAPSHTVLEAILKYCPEVNINWLILGKGEPWLNKNTDMNKVVEFENNERMEQLEIKVARMESTMDLLRKNFREIDLEAMLMVAERMLEKERTEN